MNNSLNQRRPQWAVGGEYASRVADRDAQRKAAGLVLPFTPLFFFTTERFGIRY